MKCSWNGMKWNEMDCLTICIYIFAVPRTPINIPYINSHSIWICLCIIIWTVFSISYIYIIRVYHLDAISINGFSFCFAASGFALFLFFWKIIFTTTTKRSILYIDRFTLWRLNIQTFVLSIIFIDICMRACGLCSRSNTCGLVSI